MSAPGPRSERVAGAAPQDVEFGDGDQPQNEKLEEQSHQPRDQAVHQSGRFSFRATEVVADSLKDNAPAAQQA